MDKVKNQTKYDPNAIESKWQAKWLEERIYQPNLDDPQKPYYNLMMFPYPSAEGMHVGNMYAQTGGDIHGRLKRMQGYDVFQPMGLDGFGIHSENYALKVGSHPMDQAEKSEANFYRQMKETGSGFAWENTVETWKEDYYKWTQWVFVELFKAGLAYRKNVPVNFCPSCKTVLADEQVIDTKCERCSSVVEKKDLEQWMFRITSYAEELLEGLDRIDWTEKVKIAQRNWIGKSEGATIQFEVLGETPLNGSHPLAIEVFTTRPDTLHGATFLVVSPEHPIVAEWLGHPGVKEYVSAAKSKSDADRVEQKEKTGVFSGAYALNPINNQQIPIWIADYVLVSYGTGAIMAVPAHDERDFEFAKKYDLPVKEVVKGGDGQSAYVEPGELINSADWDGLRVPQEKPKLIKDLESKGIGCAQTTYHLRDWLISRQRYWGPPIPMIYCQSCANSGKSWFTTLEGKAKDIKPEFVEQSLGWYPSELPVVLPRIEDYRPLGTGPSPLGNHPEFYETVCPECGSTARRETDVSDTFLDSAWYFYRYFSSDDKDSAWSEKREEKWMPVTIYTGGAEHSVLHLLYSRFLTKVFKDQGIVKDFNEPFPRFFAHGLIIKDGAKMSKSKGNVIVPDVYIKKFGADTLRTYLMFLGPFDQGGDFRDSGIEGMHRFIKRVWVMMTGQINPGNLTDPTAKSAMHKAIKGVTEDLETFHYNTAIAKIMTYYNFLSRKEETYEVEAKILLQLLAPFAPHITEEFWQKMETGSIHVSKWPEFDPEEVKAGETIVAVQVNGKLRGAFVLPDPQATQEEVERIAHEDPAVARNLEGKTIKKVVYVPSKILNFVV